MGQRNIRNTNQMINLEHDQQAQFHLHPDPCPQSSMNRVLLPVAESMIGFVPYHLSGSCGNPVPYGMTQYNGIHHHPLAGNPGMGPAITSNHYNPYMAPPGSSVFPSQINQGPQFFDGFGGAFKRKIADGYHENFQYSNCVAGPSSVGQSRPGALGGETVLAHNHNLLIQGNYSVQALIPASTPWLDQQFSGNRGDGSAWAWGQAHAVPYVHGNGVNGGFTGMGNMITECYQETATNGISTNFTPHPPPMYPQGHPQSLHLLPQPLHGTFYQAPGTSFGLPINSALHGSVNTFQGSMEVVPGYVGPAPPGIAVYPNTHGRALLPGATLRHHALPRFNLLPADEVAMLEIPGFNEMGNAVDHHRDMRMDVDSMTYEELLALEEHIGSVTVGLSEDIISSHLKTRTHIAPATFMELEDRETDFCTICQTDYEDQDKIGTLDCGHEFHASCIKTWLTIKNICPICKSSALTTKMKDSMREG